MGALGRVYRIGKGGAKVVAFWGGVMLLISAAMIGAGDLIGSVSDSQPTAETSETDGEGAAVDDKQPRVAEIEAAIHADVNDARAREGVGELQHSAQLAAVARNHSEAMATQGFFAHESPTGATPGDRLESAGVQCQRHGENIAWRGDRPADTGKFAAQVVEQWLASDGHRKNLYRQKWNQEGIGVYVGPERVYITQMFC
jgi:uncharacterized protein YkwD